MTTFKPEEQETNTTRKKPIPPPTYPRQYRAIGLIFGQYIPSEEKITRGNLITSDGTQIEAVLLGRLMSLMKNHLDLKKSHLWVVYPRSKQENDTLHVQLLGVWEPATFHTEEVEKTGPTNEDDPTCQSGYFSIRGEVVFYLEERETVVIKIKQSPKKESETAKFFKLKLRGTLPPRPLRHFYDLQVQLEGEELIIRESQDLGLANFQKPTKFQGKSKPFSDKPKKTNPREKPFLEKTPRSFPKIIKPVKKMDN
jgi:hypothetical protein